MAPKTPQIAVGWKPRAWNWPDAAIPTLAGLQSLEVLLVGRTKISEAGLQQLQKALPKVRFSEPSAARSSARATPLPRQPAFTKKQGNDQTSSASAQARLRERASAAKSVRRP